MQHVGAIHLVTGASGFLGSSLAMTLSRRGEKVRALVRSSSSRDRLHGFEGEIVEGDLTRSDSLCAATQGVDTVYHCAAAFRDEGIPIKVFEEVNVSGSVHLVQAAKSAGVRRFLHVSTVGVHGEIESIPANEDAPLKPEDHYQSSKLRSEQAVGAELSRINLPGVIIRPVGIYGPGDTRFLKLFQKVANRRFPMIGNGKSRYHLTYIDDLVEGMILCGSDDAAVGRTYILPGPEHVSVHEFVSIVAETLGVRPPSLFLPVLPMKIVAGIVEHSCRILRIEPPIYRRRLDFFLKDRAFDGSRARKEVGFAPKITVREGVARTALHYIEAGLLSDRFREAVETARAKTEGLLA